MIIHGDALEELRKLEDNSVDAIVCDPPAGISFMGKDWDNFGGAPAKLKKNADKYDNPFFRQSGGSAKVTPEQRQSFISFLTDVMAEALRVLKPGGHALVWSLPRTSHWTALALEDAGFEIRDCVYHIFGSGFPKSLDVSKALDKRLGAEREVVATQKVTGNAAYEIGVTPAMYDSLKYSAYTTGTKEIPITAPATPEAQQYAGFGTALKPAAECWWLCRKPLAEKSVAANVLKFGTGALNIDKSRVGNEQIVTRVAGGKGFGGNFRDDNWQPPQESYTQAHQGRWPSHLLLSHTLLCTPEQCAAGCPVAALDEQSGIRKSGGKVKHKQGDDFNFLEVHQENARNNTYERESDQGGASRYFATFRPDVPFIYSAKASRRERNEGCEALPERPGFDKNTSSVIQRRNPDTGEVTYSDYAPSARQNNHPTVKPQSLLRYMVKMICKPGGTVLDMFGGSGSTAIACIAEGFNYIIIEKEQEYIDIIRARVAHAEAKALENIA